MFQALFFLTFVLFLFLGTVTLIDSLKPNRPDRTSLVVAQYIWAILYLILAIKGI